MLKTCISVLAVVFSTPALSEGPALIVSGYSYHTKNNEQYNSANLGSGVLYNGYHVGVYVNSINHKSAYVSRAFSVVGPLSIEVGAVTGYEIAPVLPLAVPVITFGALRILAIPPGCAECPTAIGMQLKVKMRQ